MTVAGHALTALYIPRGYDSFSSLANADLLRNLLGTCFFDQLRTQEQLGYVAYVGTHCVGKQTGLQFTVQNNTGIRQQSSTSATKPFINKRVATAAKAQSAA